MNIQIEDWLFHPERWVTEMQQEQWWRSCFVPVAALERLSQTSDPTLILGAPGSGKSTALTFLQRTRDPQSQKLFTLLYPFEKWPESKAPLLPGKDHFHQLMSAAAYQLVHLFEQSPEKITHLNEFQQEAVAWFVSHYIRRRQLDVLHRKITETLGLELSTLRPFEPLYPLEPGYTDMRHQVDDLVDIIRGLGYDLIMVMSDLEPYMVSTSLEVVGDFIEWFQLLRQPAFDCRLALPYDLNALPYLRRRSSERINEVLLVYTEEELNTIIQRHLHIATQSQIRALDQLFTHPVIGNARRELLKLYNQESPGAWLKWISTALPLWVSQDSKEPLSKIEPILEAFYRQHIHLRLSLNRQGVWRGPQFIPMEKQPFDMLHKLFELRGRHDDTGHLLEVAGSNANLNTIMSRLRREIEPLKPDKKGEQTYHKAEEYIYIQNRRDRGYWLTNFIPL